jgi:amino acid transporter
MSFMSTAPGQSLSLFDCVCITVGIVIGVGIYETSPTVAACMGGAGGTIVIWLAGGLLALCGALCYAELASTYPSQGGDVVYLSRAYGPWAGFLFGWSQMAVIRPTDIALMAYIFARYASTLYAPGPQAVPLYAVAAVAGLTLVNLLGVRQGRWTQNILTVVKVAAVLFIVGIGVFSPGGSHAVHGGGASLSGLKLGLILVFYTYGGWHELAYVAAEIRNPDQNIVRAVILGTLAVVVLYLLINASFLHTLGYAAMAGSEGVATDAVATVLPGGARRLMAVIICISALGTMNGMILTGSRISYALGQRHPLFKRLGRWHPRFETPVSALLLQGVLSLLIVLLAGSFIDTILYSAPAVWLFFLGTGCALFVLRRKAPERRHAFRVVGYPIVPILFCCTCLFMLYGAVSYALAQRPVGLGMLALVLLAGALLSRSGK